MQDYIVIEIQVSALPVHTAMIVSPFGDTIAKQSYKRRTPEPEE